MLIDAPMPPVGCERGSSCRPRRRDASEARFAKSNEREFDAPVSWMLEPGICRPFSNTRLKSGPTPRTVTLRAFTDRAIDRDAA
jgi:hypothetical protein